MGYLLKPFSIRKTRGIVYTLKNRINMKEENKLPAEKERQFDITEKNILFLKHIQSGLSVKDAYKMAGYEGTTEQEPYNFYWRLKKRLNAVIEADSLDDLRLRLELSKILKRPLKDEDPVKGITVTEKLRAIEVTDKIVNGKHATNSMPAITAFVFNRPPKEEPTKIIDVEMDTPPAS